MPVQYRTFYVRKLVNVKEREQEEYKKSSGGQDAPSSKVVKGPNINRTPS